jgi:hypothetical protein
MYICVQNKAVGGVFNGGGIIDKIISKSGEMGKKNNFLRKIGLIPKYSEISLYLTALTFVLLFLTNRDIGDILFDFCFDDLGGVVFFFVFFMGLVSSFYFAVSDVVTPKFIKSSMLLFVISTNLGVAVYGGLYILENLEGFLIVFPVLNMINAFLMLLLLRMQVINEESISNENARPREILVGSVSLVILFVFSQYLLRNFWAVTFSLCLTYSSMINDFVTRLFFRE